eukprot:COSAG01_NODE_8476_length_2772_cov_1.351291_5_plen_92_part_01
MHGSLYDSIVRRTSGHTSCTISTHAPRCVGAGAGCGAVRDDADAARRAATHTQHACSRQAESKPMRACVRAFPTTIDARGRRAGRGGGGGGR